MKNPDWTRDELILALDLYFQVDYGQMHGRNPRLHELSQLLRSLGIHKEIPDPDKFRSIGSVSLKLANFKKFDQNFEGKGMRDGSTLDRLIWKEFHKHRDTLKKEATRIRKKLLRQHSIKKHSLVVNEPASAYGKDFMMQYHKHRESDPLLIKRKMEIALMESNSLVCEVCGFDFSKTYGEMGKETIEFHFNRDAKQLMDASEISVNEISLVCSNCHKMLDKYLGVLSVSDLKKIVRGKT